MLAIDYKKQRENVRKSGILKKENFAKFIDSIVTFLDYRGYSYNHFFVNKIGDDEFLIKMSFATKSNKELYTNKIDPTLTNQVDTEIKILQLFEKRLLTPRATNGIIRIIDYEKCTGCVSAIDYDTTCENLDVGVDGDRVDGDRDDAHTDDKTTVVNSFLCDMKEMLNNDLIYDFYSLICLERGNITFGRYLRRYAGDTPGAYAVTKSIIWQILYTVYVIQCEWPDFSHNDLHVDNVVLFYDPHFDADDEQSFVRYKTPLGVFTVPYFGITAKIIDFGFAQVKSAGIVSHVRDEIGIMVKRPPSDMLFLLSEVYNSADSDQVRDLVEVLDPSGFYFTHDFRYLKKYPDQVKSARDMIQNPVWNNYKKNSGKVVLTFDSESR